MLVALSHMCPEFVLVMVDFITREFPHFVYVALPRTVSVIDAREKLGTSVLM